MAAFATRGLSFELVEHCSREHQPVTSPFILTEVRDKLVSKIGVAAPVAEAAVTLSRSRFMVIEPAELPREVCRDRDDDAVLGTAVAGGCDLIVTGDRDLLDLETYEKISIVSPREFWRREFLSGNRE